MKAREMGNGVRGVGEAREGSGKRRGRGKGGGVGKDWRG